MPHLSAKALEEDPEGCALLLLVLRSAVLLRPPAAQDDTDGIRLDATPPVIFSDAPAGAPRPPCASRHRATLAKGPAGGRIRRRSGSRS